MEMVPAEEGRELRVYLLDQTWLPFSNLMLRHVYNVLLICSDYDRYTIEEDGRVEEELYREYTELGLSTPPKITHTTSDASALRLIKERSFDLVITMLDLGSDRVEQLAANIKKLKPYMPVIALSPSQDHRKVKELKDGNCPDIDYLFYWQGNPYLFLAMVKLVEDRMNIDHDTREADVQVIILVEDSVRFISSYLPQMYTSLIHQTRASIQEALNEWGKTLRMRGRPKIVLARTYEEAWRLYATYRKNILGVITDVSYPSREGKDKSGLRLCKAVRKDNPEVPVLIQSTDMSNKADAEKLGADFIWKLSGSLHKDLERHFLERYNFGPFIFRDPDNGKEIARANTMKEVQYAIREIPIGSFRYHTKRNDFSRWFRAQSLYTLATRIKHINLDDGLPDEDVRNLMYRTIKDYRADRARGVIAEFSESTYDETLLFSRIGRASLGGKGRGLAFIAMEMKGYGIAERYPQVYLSIPRTVVVTNELFTSFLEINGYAPSDFQELTDHEIVKRFLEGKTPERLVSALKAVLRVIRKPISVRSSSLLEDSHYQPFAGVYSTCMIPNNGSDEKRLSELVQAVKTVWASTYLSVAREYMKRTGHNAEEEKMSVLIQQVTGSRHGDCWYPEISGVARSLNYYPVPGQKAEDGVGMLAFGFGKTIVDEGTALRFCPARPRASMMGEEVSAQDRFYALDLTKPFNPYENSDNLVARSIQEEIAAFPKAFRGIASTLDMYSGMISESPRAKGEKMLTFNGVLKYDMIPLARIIDDMLKLGTETMGEPVEIEFAVGMEHEGVPDFSILQIRPISGLSGYAPEPVTQDERKEAFIYAEKVMGNGTVTDITDIISIKPDAFRREDMVAMASELDLLNKAAGNDYVLIAAGRLGSSDRWLGIPCAWSQISKARVIVETGLKEIQAEPSLGTHFFQNMTSLGCLYFTVNPMHRDGRIDYGRIFSLPVVQETEHFMHVRAAKPLIIKADGLHGLGAVLLQGER